MKFLTQLYLNSIKNKNKHKNKTKCVKPICSTKRLCIIHRHYRQTLLKKFFNQWVHNSVLNDLEWDESLELVPTQM